MGIHSVAPKAANNASSRIKYTRRGRAKYCGPRLRGPGSGSWSRSWSRSSVISTASIEVRCRGSTGRETLNAEAFRVNLESYVELECMRYGRQSRPHMPSVVRMPRRVDQKICSGTPDCEKSPRWGSRVTYPTYCTKYMVPGTAAELSTKAKST